MRKTLVYIILPVIALNKFVLVPTYGSEAPCFVRQAVSREVNSRGGDDRGKPADYQFKLQSLIEEKWEDYVEDKPNWHGGIAMLLMTPKGKFFVSTGMDTIDENVHFRGASTTKTFTAVAIMLLQQQGKLDINHKITDNIPHSSEPYVPNEANYNIPYKDQITIKLLLQHKAGVFDLGNKTVPSDKAVPYAGQKYIDYVKETLNDPYHTFTFDELIGVVATCKLFDFAPGTRFHYSNTGYWILGKIIERVSGKNYCQFIQDELLEPNGLNETSFPHLGTDVKVPLPYVRGYAWKGNEIFENTEDNVSAIVAEGNIISTPIDLANWVKIWISGNAGLKKQYIDQMMSVEATGEEHLFYGLGTNYTPGLGYGHNGGRPGYLTVMRYDPIQDVSVLIFSSVMNGDDIYGEVNFMYDLGRNAKKLMGYSADEM